MTGRALHLRTRSVAADGTEQLDRDPRGHAWGTEQVVAHIERRWCPTVTSDQLAGGIRFRFRGDRETG